MLASETFIPTRPTVEPLKIETDNDLKRVPVLPMCDIPMIDGDTSTQPGADEPGTPGTEPPSPFGNAENSASSIPAGFEAPKQSSTPKTLLIFDWDDTLMPSSFLSANKMRLDSECVVSPEMLAHLDKIAQVSKHTLEVAKSYGEVVIVTNAEQGWIDLSCKKFMPSLFETVKTVPQISARSSWEPLGFRSPFEWKIQAFASVIEKFARQLPSDMKYSVASFGDSAHEREAVLNVTSGLENCVCKSLKFVERPSVEQMIKEHKLIMDCMPQIATHLRALDLCIRCS